MMDRYVSATYHRHQERQDPTFTGGWFAPSASAARFVKKLSPSSANSTPRARRGRAPSPTPSSAVERQPGLFDGRSARRAGRPPSSASCDWNAAGASAMSGWPGDCGRPSGLDTLLARLLPAGREDVPWARMAAVLVIARLCEPSSELHIAEDWFRRTALGDLLGVPEAKINDDRLYRALDHLLPHKEQLWKSTSRNGSARCSAWNTTCCSTTSPARTSRAKPRRQPAGSARLLARSPPRLQAGLHRPGGQPRRLSAGLRGLRRQPPRQYDRRRKSSNAWKHATAEQGRIWVLDRGMVSDATSGLAARRAARTTSSARPRVA